MNRIDLGGLRVPVPPDTEVRVDVSPDGKVVAATLVRGASAMQVNAFAAPRRSGIWDEVRGEIADALRQGGGKAADVEGPFGTELHAAVPTEVAGQGKVLAPARFLGVDGPRWFLRALLTGPAAVEAAAAVPMLDRAQALRRRAGHRGDGRARPAAAAPAEGGHRSRCRGAVDRAAVVRAAADGAPGARPGDHRDPVAVSR